MQIRAVLKLKNGAIIRAREALGMSQTDLAKASGVGNQLINKIENMRYAPKRYSSQFKKLCWYLGLCAEEILPPELLGQEIVSSFVANLNMESLQLKELNKNYQQRMLEASPVDLIQVKDEMDFVKSIIDTDLSCREKTIMKLRYGIGEDYSFSLEEIARIFKVTRGRVKQVEAMAMRKIRGGIEKRKRAEGLFNAPTKKSN